MAKKLKLMRQERGMTMRDLANLIGVHYSLVSYWENGQRNPSKRNKVKLSNMFQMSCEELLEDE